MPIPADRRRSWLARQVGSLALAQVRVDNPMAPLRAAAWHNTVLRLGLALPLFVVHDLGMLLTVPRGAGRLVFGLPPETLGRNLVPAAMRPAVDRYGELLRQIAESEVVERAASWRLRDDLVAALIARVTGDVYAAWGARAKGIGAEELPLDPQLYDGADVQAHFVDFDTEAIWSFVRHLGDRAWQLYTAVELIDLDTLRLLGLFQGPSSAASALDLPDLLAALQSPEAADVVNFSLDLLPSVLETRRAGGLQTFAVDGYASLERRGHIDSMVLSEFAYDEDLFERKIVDDELYYYGREKPREEERRLHYVLVDASASMRGARQVFARGLALTLAKKLALEGDEVWIRFFDSRLYDVVKVTRSGSSSIPTLLTFRSERGRNYGKVFRQIFFEVSRLRREAHRHVALYVFTHGQCHIPVELVAQLKRVAYLYGVILLPSREVALDYLPLFDRHQIVTAETLASREGRKKQALGILRESSAKAAGAARAQSERGPGGSHHADGEPHHGR